jgi:Glyoxalase-like domain
VPGVVGNITFDCESPNRVADFWCAVLGYVKQDVSELPLNDDPSSPLYRDSFAAALHPAGRWVGPRLFFQRVPEGKTVKNRLHIDVNVGDEATMEAEADRLVGLGARRVQRYEEHDEVWIWMEDVEGNEFCIQPGSLPPGASG